MKALQCEMCGSQDLVKDGGVFVCQSCGTKYTVEEAKKMMVEGTVDVKGTVKVDTSDELKNLYEIARRAKDSDNRENAAKYYDMILVKDPSSWEANFYVVYFKAASCTIGEITSEAQNVENCIKPVLELIKNKITDTDTQDKAIIEVCVRTLSLSKTLFNGALNHYNKFSTVQGQADKSANALFFSGRISYTLGDLLEELFNGRFKKIVIEAWTQGIKMFNDSQNAYIVAQGNILQPQKQIAESYQNRIRNLDPQASAPEVKSGCMILLLIALSPIIAFTGYLITRALS